MSKAAMLSWYQLVPKDIQPTLEHFDEELTRLVGLAAYIGDASGDQTPISYTSLVIAMLWSDDPTSKWFQEYVQNHNVAADKIYRHRGIKETDRKYILDLFQRDEEFKHMGKDFMSNSSRAMLHNAESIANEVEQAGSISVRHLLAAYSFRNPTYHEQDLKSWDFDTEDLRRVFTKYIGKNFPQEAQYWHSIMRGYVTPLAEDVDKEYEPGIILANYTLEDDAIELLRITEALATDRSLPAMNTLSMLNILLFVRLQYSRMSEIFRNAVSSQNVDLDALHEKFGEVTLNSKYELVPFVSGSSLGISSGLKRTLDRARTISYTTDSENKLAMRHIVAALIVHPDTFAAKVLEDINVEFSDLRRDLLDGITRDWLGDDGIEWNRILIGVTPPTLTPYKSDNPDEGDDCLDVGRYASAFATVMAAEGNKPPMSIGIFGDWGSGKSFFMRLMREKTITITQQQDKDEAGNRVFCENVLPIEFNAWHYAEGNLWASLVHTILQELERTVMKDKLQAQKIEELELCKTAKEEAENRKAGVLAQRDAAQKHYDAVEKRHDELREKLEKLSVPMVLTAMTQEYLADKDVDEILSLAEDKLGFKGAKTRRRDAESLNKLLDDAREQYSEMKSQWQWVKQPHVYTPLAVTAVLVASFGGLGIYFWHQYADVNGMTAFIVELSSVITLVLARSRSILNGIKHTMSRLGGLRSKLDILQQAKMQQHSLALEKARREWQQAEDELSRASEALTLAEVDLSRIEKEIDGRTSIDQIADMIDRRLTGRDYEKHLSIVSMIRRDFQTLSDYFAEPKIVKNSSTGLKRIDRIVLYIDDLDRCPSDQVVKVLEAVHLMLAFKLFVVVVGVDMRWASISLHEHYPAHLSSLDGSEPRKSSSIRTKNTASTMDYLEKIFQIPFWLPPMDVKASRDMLATLVPVTHGAEESHQEQQGKTRTVEEEFPEKSGGEPDKNAAEKGEETKQQGSEMLPAAESLEIAPGERKYMLNLAGAVGRSPRRLKRFVNTYRILKASCDPLERKRFVTNNGEDGSYRAVMTLLAITTGAPRAALQILLSLNEKDTHYKLKDFHNDLEAIPRGLVNGEVQYALNALKVYADNGTPKPSDIRELKKWVSRAAHFSFRSGRI